MHMHMHMHTHGLRGRLKTGSLLVLLEMGRYPLQVNWLQRTINYWNKLVANKADSKLLNACLADNVWYGLQEGHTCWAKELNEGLRFVAPERDWKAHMTQVLPIESAKDITQLAKKKFADSVLQYDEDPTEPECPHRQQ